MDGEEEDEKSYSDSVTDSDCSRDHIGKYLVDDPTCQIRSAIEVKLWDRISQQYGDGSFKVGYYLKKNVGLSKIYQNLNGDYHIMKKFFKMLQENAKKKLPAQSYSTDS